MKRAFSTYFLMFLMVFEVISAAPAGVMLIMDPSGAMLGLPGNMLDQSPFPNFLIPGIFLLLVLGLLPALIFYGLISKKEIKLLEKLNVYKDYHWSWTFSFYLGLILVMWINMELLFVRVFDMLQFIYSMLGVLLIIITHLPATKRNYKR